MRRPPIPARLTARGTACAAAVALMLVATGCSGGAGSGAGSGTGKPVKGGSVSFAMPPNATPNWILPIGTAGHLATFNSSIHTEMFLPLVKYDATGGKLAFDEKASAAEKPVYSKDDTSVTITLHDLKWANGKPVTSRDVQFWVNLIKANTDDWAGYRKGELPDNIEKFTILDDQKFKLDLTHAVNPEWFTASQLSQVTPLPQSAWDVKSDGGEVGDYDTKPDGARKVFSYLVKESKDLSSYPTNPLWKVTNGPFDVAKWTSTGQVTLKKSDTYSGTDAAHLDTVELKPFTSADAEFNVLRSGNIDYGYIPSSNLSQKKYLNSRGYKVEAWNGWAVNYAPYNFNNPKLGGAFKQLYVRQAIQMGIDQDALAKVVWHGQATPVFGPVPQNPPSDFLSAAQKKNPYPHDPGKAKGLLTSHGWTVGADGIMACTSPGDGANQCGKDVAKGTKLQLHMLSESGSTATTNQMRAMQSQLSKIGVGFQTKYEPLNSVLSGTTQCTSDEPSCAWQLSFFGTQGSWYYPAYPTGGSLFGSSGASNFGGYDDPHADKLIDATTKSPDPGAMKKYSGYLAQQLPALWLPLPSYQVSAIKKSLGGVSQDPLAGMTMQRWYLTK